MDTVASPAAPTRMKPYCNSLKRGSLGSDIDGRSVEGKFLRRIEAELVEQVGGAPSFAQRLTIRRIARLMLQAELFDAKMGSGDWTPHDSRTASGVNNAVLRALKDIGIKGRAEKPPSVSLADVVARHAKAAPA